MKGITTIMNCKRYFGLIMALAMVLVLLSACGSTGSVSNKSAADASEPQTTAGASAEPSYPLTTDDVTLSFFFQTDATSLSRIDEMQNNAVFAAAEELTGVHIELEPTSNDAFEEQFNIRLGAGTMSDLIQDFDRGYSSGLDFAVEEGLVLNLEDYSSQCSNYISAVTADEGVSKDAHTDSGYLPAFYRLTDTQRITMSMVIRQDWLDALELAAPVTYDDVHDTLAAFKSEYDCQGLHLYQDISIAFADGFNALFTTYNTYLPFYQVDGTVKYGLMQNDFKEYVTMLNSWFNEGLLYKDGLNLEYHALFSFESDASAVTNGEVGIFRTFADQLISFEDMADGNISLAPMATPVREEGQKVSVAAGHIDNGAHVSANYMTVVNGSCEYPEIAVEWMNYWYTEDGINMVDYGIEDVTYTHDQDGQVCFTDLILDNGGLNPTTALKLVGGSVLPSYVPADVLDSTLTPQALNCYEVWASNRNADRIIPSTVIMTADESTSFNEIMNDINTYTAEAILQFVTGEKSVDEFDNFTAQLVEMGIEDAISLKQAAYDRYLSR